jgi:hypothetical protein
MRSWQLFLCSSRHHCFLFACHVTGCRHAHVRAGEHLRPHFAALVGVAAAGLRDGSGRVRTAALAAVATLVQWVAEEPEVRQFRELVPTMLQARALPMAFPLCLGLSPTLLVSGLCAP